MSEMKVGGSVSLKGPLEFRNIDIGGTLRVEGDLSITGEFRAGGSVRIDGNLRVNVAKIGGSMKISGKLISSEFNMGGSVTIREGIVRDLNIGGSMKAEIVYAENARISGSFTGVLVARIVVVEKKSKIKGKIVAERLVVKRRSEVDEAYAVDVEVERDAEVSRLSCVRCKLGKRSWIGYLRYKETYEADGAEIDKTEKVDEIPELVKLQELDKKLSEAVFEK